MRVFQLGHQAIGARSSKCESHLYAKEKTLGPSPDGRQLCEPISVPTCVNKVVKTTKALNVMIFVNKKY